MTNTDGDKARQTWAQVKCKKRKKNNKKKNHKACCDFRMRLRKLNVQLYFISGLICISMSSFRNTRAVPLCYKSLPSKREPWKCSQTRHLPQTRSLDLHAACRRDRFQVEVEKWKWSRELSTPPAPSLLLQCHLILECVKMCFFEVYLLFFILVCKRATKVSLRHRVLQKHVPTA